jgi:uncharacterized protein DUF2019
MAAPRLANPARKPVAAEGASGGEAQHSEDQDRQTTQARSIQIFNIQNFSIQARSNFAATGQKKAAEMRCRETAGKLKHTLATLPIEAARQLKTIAETHWMPQAGEAGMCLEFLDDGTFRPN